jgi:hypothetical protein
MRTRTKCAIALLALFQAIACGGGGQGSKVESVPGAGGEGVDPTAGTGTGSGEPGAATVLNGDIIRDWGEAAYAAALAHDKYAVPHYDDRAWVLMALAQHDAINSAQRRFEGYAYTADNAGADPIAAASQAAHDILIAYFPKQAAEIDAKNAAWLGKVADGEAKARGVAAGAEAAKAVIAKRTGDGWDKPSEYKPTKKLGAWQYTPPFDKMAYNPHVGAMTPFALTSHDQFRPVPPPALTSPEYAKAFDEVKSVGAKDSKTRTADESSYGQFWYEYSVAGWNRIARIVSAEKQSDLWETARLFAMLNVAMWDGWIAGFNAKYFYAPTVGWRPLTAIHDAKKDGNPKTEPDPTWEPFMGTPPVPDYPSTHSVLGAAASVVLIAFYGDETPFTFASPSSNPPGQPRSFTSFSKAAEENADSRVKIGIHFRFATDAGLKQGREVARYVVETQMKPVAAR